MGDDAFQPKRTRDVSVNVGEQITYHVVRSPAKSRGQLLPQSSSSSNSKLNIRH